MAGRVLNRRELRKQADTADQSTTIKAVPARKARVKAPAVPRVRKARAKKAPTRMCARWGVFDGGMKQIAIFDYNQRAAADEKLALLNAKKSGSHFVQIVKEPMPEPPPVAVAPADESA